MSPGQVVLFIMGTVVIICGAYYATYYVGVKTSKLRLRGNRSIVLRDRFAISKDKSFCLVEIKGKVYVVGVTNNSITLLDTLAADEFGNIDEKPDGFYHSTMDGLQNKIVNSFAGFLTSRIKKPPENSHSTSVPKGGAFAEKLKKAKGRVEEEIEKPNYNMNQDDNPDGKV